ncbi:hypothetical protein [Streptomyces spectabilis]|uniref:hypothetical protein n=1 Tax=Streptomyces spectabilis TaxID=68270 RepID=UPI003F4CEE42
MRGDARPPGAQSAASRQLAVGQPVLTVGGSGGSDPYPRLARFESLPAAPTPPRPSRPGPPPPSRRPGPRAPRSTTRLGRMSERLRKLLVHRKATPLRCMTHSASYTVEEEPP